MLECVSNELIDRYSVFFREQGSVFFLLWANLGVKRYVFLTGFHRHFIAPCESITTGILSQVKPKVNIILRSVYGIICTSGRLLRLYARGGRNAMSKLRTFLQSERGARGWSLTDLSEKSGIPMATLSRYESLASRHKPSHDNVLRLARAFDKDTGDILRFIGYPRREHSTDERDGEWTKLRGLLESDPRAKRILELYDGATDEDRDIGIELLEVHFKQHPHRRR